MTTYTLELPWSKPPLTANQRLHWREKSARTRMIRRAVELLARNAKVPVTEGCTVSLVWHVTTSHRRDEDNLVPTLKAACDGLVDAGVVPDDTPQYMHKLMPVIRRAPEAALLLIVTVDE